MITRDKLILEALRDLDLSPTMEINARDKYKAIATYLENNGVESDFYPQGSFLTGTVVRPYRNGKSQNYDLDVLVILDEEKEDTTPYQVKNRVGDILKASDLYKDKFDKEDSNCWTLNYAEILKDAGFSMDLVPSIEEVENIKEEMMYSGVPSNYISETVSITEKIQEQYDWITSNPLGFGNWFLDISNKQLTAESKLKQYRNLNEDILRVFNKVEDVPTYIYRSSLQKAVQFVKRHRDIYYDRSDRNEDKPSSFLLTSLIADSVKDEPSMGIEEILRHFIYKFIKQSIAIMIDGKILNPVDNRENLIEGYSEKRIALMKKWLGSLKEDIDILDNDKFRLQLYNNINEKLSLSNHKDVNVITPRKPWRI